MNSFAISDADRRLIPSSGLRGPVPLLIAIMTFVMVVVAAAGLALANTGAVIRAGAEHRYSIQIADGAAKAPAAIAAARAQPGVGRVNQVDPAELRRTLERWLGPASAEADLPLPAVIDVDLKPGADPAAVASAIRKAVPSARFVGHRTSLAPLLKALRGLTLLAMGLVLMIALASAAAIVLAARGALDTHRGTIEVMHGIGATDEQITRLFQRKIAVDALAGSLMGGAIAAIVLALLAASASFAGELTGGVSLAPGDLVLLALVPIALTALSTWVARTAVLAALRQTL